MKEILVSPVERKEDKDPWEKDLESMRKFSSEHDISYQDMTIAYELAMGFSDDEIDDPITDTIQDLAQMMKKSMEEGLTANRIVELIARKKEFDLLPQTYRRFVNDLVLSENEKRVLLSLVETHRKGTLVISDEKTSQELGEVQISGEGAMKRENIIAFELMNFLAKFKDSKISVTFSED